MRVDAQEQAISVISAPTRPEPVQTVKPADTRVEGKKTEAAGADQLAKQAEKPVGKEALTNAVELANKVMEITERHLVFRMHEKSGLVQVSVVEEGSRGEKVIREIPSDKMLEMAAQLREQMDQATGLLLNELV